MLLLFLFLMLMAAVLSDSECFRQQEEPTAAAGQLVLSCYFCTWVCFPKFSGLDPDSQSVWSQIPLKWPMLVPKNFDRMDIWPEFHIWELENLLRI